MPPLTEEMFIYFQNMAVIISIISGGTIESITAHSGSYDITGGIFSGGVFIVDDTTETSNGGIFGQVSMFIKGGTFTSDFGYSSLYNEPDHLLTFYGDLSLDIPTLVSGTYITTITGTLLDGTAISQKISCYDAPGDCPCSRVTTVPEPNVLALSGIGLVGLTVARYKKKT